MGNENEPAKLLLPYLQRADELQKHEPLVAYYCRLYAMEWGLKIPVKERTKTTSALLISLMNQLEKDRKSLKLSAEDNLYVEGFALNVFAKADKQDRAGRADLNTAKTFYAASIFFEILGQFGEIQPDIEQKQKYSVWKAAEIRKALKEGRRPEPGPPAGDHDLSSSVDKAWEEEESSPEQLSPEKPQVGQPRDSARTISDGGTKPETASQFTGSFQQYSSDKGDPNTVFPAADYRSTAAHGSHGRAPNEFSEYSQSNSSAYSGSYYNMPAAPQDGTSSHINTGYSYSVSAPIHDCSNVPLSYDVPNYQPYPTMHDGSFDSQPTEHTSYPVNASYYPNTTGSHPMAVPYHSNPPISGYQSTAQHTSVAGRNGAYGESTQLEHATSAPAATFSYNSNYQPPPEKIAEAHKAARFAVGALAFDDVPTAVDHLKRSLELLTLPSTSV